MRTKMIVAILLIALGIVCLAYQGIRYTTHEKVINLGPLQVATEHTHNIPLPPIVGALALTGGIVLLVMDMKRA